MSQGQQYNKCLTNVNVTFCRYVTWPDNTTKYNNAKPRVFPLFKKKCKKCNINSPSLELENSYSFNLHNLGKYFKHQNIHAECDLAYEHQKSERFTKIL